MHIVLEDQLLVNLPREAMEDSDTFRNENLYTKACDSVLQVRMWITKVEGEVLQGSSAFPTSNDTTPSACFEVFCVVVMRSTRYGLCWAGWSTYLNFARWGNHSRTVVVKVLVWHPKG